MSVATQIRTAAEFDALGPEFEKLFEVIDGELVEVEGMGGRHGGINTQLVFDLWGFVRPRRLGRVVTEGTRFVIQEDPLIIFMPDVSFIRADRLPPDLELGAGTIPIVPDLAIEVVSPNDSAPAVRRRGQRYLDAGVRLVWLVWPERRAVSVLRANRPEVLLTEHETLDGEDVLPGFRLLVAEIFAV